MIFYVCCMKNYILAGFFTFITVVSFGSDFRYLTTDNGLTDGEINSIVQDGSGNMWFATWSGLIKYDGFFYEVFRPELGNPVSLPEKKVKLVFVDSHDNLWIATSMNLSRYNKINNSFQTFKFQEAGSRGVNILNLLEYNSQLIIHAVEGIFYIPLLKPIQQDYLVKRKQLLYQEEIPTNYFQFSASAGNRLVLVNNSQGSGQIYLSSFKNAHDPQFISADTVIELNQPVNDIKYIASENALYIATSTGLLSYSISNHRFTEADFFRGYDLQQIYYASNNRIYGSVRGPRLVYLDLHTGNTKTYEPKPYIPGSLLDNEILTLFEDFSGNLWVGHQGQGISILNLYQKKFYTHIRDPFSKTSLNSNTIMCFNGTGNEILIGCRNNGLNIVSKNQTTGVDISFLRLGLNSGNAPAANDGIWDIARQSDSLFWLGTEMGLYRLQKTKSGWKLEPFNGTPAINHSIRKVFIDSNNNIWCGSHGFGLYFIPNLNHNRGGFSYHFESIPENPESLSDNVILDIFLDSKKRLWIGTNNGLNKLTIDYENLDLSGKNKPELRFKRYVATRKQENFLNNNEINSFFENFDGNIWIATQGGGINILNPLTEKFSHLTVENGLPSNDVISMIPDEDGNLWISTNKGLVRYNRFESPPSFTVFNASDGIQGDIFMVNSSYKAPDGQMFFGGDKGFTTFYPRDIKMNEIKPKISFTNLRIRNKIIKIGDTLHRRSLLETALNETNEITLPFKSNVFSIGVSSLHFQQPDQNSITYMLDGFNERWITVPATSGYIYLSNIPPGKYNLRARAISSDGILSEAEKQIGIEILPPWYRAGLAFVFYAIFALLIAYVIIYVIINRQKLIYQKKLDKVTIENNENKMLFLTNIAHELRTPLSLIIAPIEDLVKNTEINSGWENQFQLIFRNSRYLLRLINQIIDFRKLDAGKLSFQPHHANVTEVVKDVALNFKGHEAKRNITLHIDVPETPVYGFIDVQKFEEVLYNLISNAYKHTFDNHTITVSLNISEQEPVNSSENIRLTVFNEGKQIDEIYQGRIFERFFKVDENSEGAGIGLSFSKSLVEMHKGTIEVESVPGKGVAFHVVIPTSKMEVKNPEPDAGVSEILTRGYPIQIPDSSFSGALNGGAKILIAEDNTELGEFLKSVFSRKYKCYLAANGTEAWKMVQKYSPSVIVSDIIMPGMSGLELCRKIKGNKETCHIPVLLLTAKDSPFQVTEGYAGGADSYVTKPFDIELLMSQIDRLIQNRELIREKYKTQNFMIEVKGNSSSRDEEFVKAVRKILEDNISDPELNVNSLSQQMNISTTQLYRKLKELTGHSPVEFIRSIKLQKAYSLLNARNNTVKEVCYLTGFNNMSYFIKCFREQFGVTPAYFRDRGLQEKPIEDKNIIQM
jgi:signal transduction histidine kinase/ligand-binding sensor domain-containing protein/DNA-binding response OmpR family regulator